ncbi:MAG: hypothetical protein F6J87_28180 [Spirulina sp. SIO3F2]|nr:hypothetical protein [Spirulina sp. SIO3F2]
MYEKQAERIEQLLANTGIYYVSPIGFEDSEIHINTSWLSTIKTFDAAMEVIMQLSDLDLSRDPDELLDSVQEILSQSD